MTDPYPNQFQDENQPVRPSNLDELLHLSRLDDGIGAVVIDPKVVELATVGKSNYPFLVDPKSEAEVATIRHCVVELAE